MSAARVLRGPSHHCDIGYPRDGQIVQCGECGKVWRGVCPGNPNYDRWFRVSWLGRKLRRLP